LGQTLVIDIKLLEISSILFLASAFRTAFGFGEALIAVPLLAIFLPIQLAAPVAVLASILIAGFSVLKDWKHVHIGSAGRLVGSTVFGIPLGLLLLKTGSEPLVKGLLATLLILFACYSLWGPGNLSLKDDRFALVFGFFAGICGGSYGVNGPPLAIYGALRGWTPEKFRATLQGYFLPASLLGMCGYGVSGLWTAEVNLTFLYALPAIAVGIFVGRFLSARVTGRHFARLVNIALLFISAILLYQAFYSHT
jgi:uncharacterized membrane protein YfcA